MASLSEMESGQVSVWGWWGPLSIYRRSDINRSILVAILIITIQCVESKVSHITRVKSRSKACLLQVSTSVTLGDVFTSWVRMVAKSGPRSWSALVFS